MHGASIKTSLILIATGAILAFAVTDQTSGVSIQAVGVILMPVGLTRTLPLVPVPTVTVR
jgi:hypothetical protein